MISSVNFLVQANILHNISFWRILLICSVIVTDALCSPFYLLVLVTNLSRLAARVGKQNVSRERKVKCIFQHAVCFLAK